MAHNVVGVNKTFQELTCSQLSDSQRYVPFTPSRYISHTKLLKWSNVCLAP